MAKVHVTILQTVESYLSVDVITDDPSKVEGIALDHLRNGPLVWDEDQPRRIVRRVVQIQYESAVKKIYPTE